MGWDALRDGDGLAPMARGGNRARMPQDRRSAGPAPLGRPGRLSPAQRQAGRLCSRSSASPSPAWSSRFGPPR